VGIFGVDFSIIVDSLGAQRVLEIAHVALNKVFVS
jgi:hypothetical protein